MAANSGPTPQHDAIDPGLCPWCRIPLKHWEDARFRVGGSGALGHMLLGNLAEMGEGFVELDLWACTQCRSVVPRIPPNS